MLGAACKNFLNFLLVAIKPSIPVLMLSTSLELGSALMKSICNKYPVHIMFVSCYN